MRFSNIFKLFSVRVNFIQNQECPTASRSTSIRSWPINWITVSESRIEEMQPSVIWLLLWSVRIVWVQQLKLFQELSGYFRANNVCGRFLHRSFRMQ